MLKLIRSLRLPDGSHHYAASADGRRFVVCSDSGAGVLLDDGLGQLARFELQGNVEWVQLNDDASLLLVGFPDRVEGCAVGHDVRRAVTLPVAATTVSPCAFSRDEPVVCIASWDRDPVLGAYDLLTARRIAEQPLPARGGEGYWLVPHPEREAMGTIAYSGQGDEWLFWAHYRDGRLRVFERPELEYVTLPQFDPSGAEFVSIQGPTCLSRMRFPSGEILATIEAEDAFPDDPDAYFNYYAHHLRPGRVLAWQDGASLYELDLDTLRPTRCVLSGVEGKTFGEDSFSSGQSWPVAGGRLLTSDRQFDKAFRSSTTTLRLWDASDLYGPPVKPDPDRPFTKQLLAMA